MKKHLIKIYSFLFIFTLLTSCETEPLDPVLKQQLLIPENTDCSAPFSINATFATPTSAVLNWSTSPGVSSWQIQYGVKDFALGNGTIVSSDSTTRSITGLSSNNSYDFYVRSVCGAQEYGSWIFYTLETPNVNCATPSGLTVVRNSNNTSATVNWTAGGSETQWEVIYTNAGFPSSGGTSLITSTKPFTVTGLVSTQSYDFYVRAKCSATETSTLTALTNLAAVSTGGTTGISGDYLLTNLNSSVPTDINNDGTSSSNILSETACYNNMHLILLANNSFTQDSKGVDIDIVVENGVETTTIACFTDPIETGTWALNGSILTLSYPGTTETVSYNFNATNNTLTATVNDGEIVGTTTDGAPITLTTNLTITFTKQ